LLKQLEIKPCIGLSELLFGASMEDTEKMFGKTTDIDLFDDIDEAKSIVWHYWDFGFSLFFDEENKQGFCCVEIDNDDAILFGEKIFSLKEKQIIELFKQHNYTSFETELHEWGEKRLSFDDANIDFYFEQNKLISINYGKAFPSSNILILPN